ncbi:MAG: hypothetical protein Q8N47_05150 [Bryobacterales bacterium]|nr:hypothetical protein [Bryobacterales bacterium]
MYLTHIGIADILLEVRSPLSPAALGIEEKLGPFFGHAADSPEKVLIDWREGDPVRPPEGNLIYDPGTMWRMYASSDRRTFHAHISYPAAEHEKPTEALLTANPTWSELSLTERRQGAPWRSLLSLGVGELIVRTRILFAGGIVFHASGIDDGGRGIVFVGHSGAGKSTLAELWSNVAGVGPMNDDRVAVRLTDGGAVAYGLPWGGAAGIERNCRAPLSALFVLEQSRDNAVHALPEKSSIPLLLARSFLPYWDRELMLRALAVVEALVERVPVYLLRWRLEPSVVPLVRSVL